MPRLRSLLARKDLPSRFERWEVSIPTGAELATSRRAWSGAIVLVERGEVEVDCVGGCRRTFSRGDMLALGWLSPRRLRNPGRGEVRLVAVRRRKSNEGQAETAPGPNRVASDR